MGGRVNITLVAAAVEYYSKIEINKSVANEARVCLRRQQRDQCEVSENLLMHLKSMDLRTIMNQFLFSR